MGKGGKGGMGNKMTISKLYQHRSPSEVSHWKIFYQSLPYLWPKNKFCLRIQLIFSLFFMIAATTSELYAPVPIKRIISEMTNISEKSSHHSFSSTILKDFIFFGFIYAGTKIFPHLRDFFFAGISAETERAVSVKTFCHLQRLSLSFHVQRETGAIVTSITRGAKTNSDLLKSTLFTVTPMFIKMVCIVIIFAFLYHWYLSVGTSFAICCYFFCTFVATRWRDHYLQIVNVKQNEKNTRMIDALLNYETMKYFNADLHEENRYKESAEEHARAQEKALHIYSLTSMAQSLIISAATVITLVFVGYQVIDHRISIAEFVMIQQYLDRLYEPMDQLAKMYRDIRQNVLDADAMIHLLKEPVDVDDEPGAPPFDMKSDEPTVVEFQNVSFDYDTDEKNNRTPLVDDLSFKIQSGERVAIVGPSGAGKSTLVRLLNRFYDPKKGCILINGQNIAQVQQLTLRQHLGVVPQDCVLFSNTIAYNIGYGCVTHDATQEQIIEVSKRAGIHEFIIALPHGYETKVGERGLKLSGGERQRIAIARALLKNPKIMIFDEATSSLDSLIESKILSVMNAAGKDRVCLTIAHRLSTIVDADRIIVFKKSKIIEMGKHEELLKIENGVYKSLWEQQNRIGRVSDEEKTDEHMFVEKRCETQRSEYSSQKVTDKLLSSSVTKSSYKTFDDPSQNYPLITSS